MNEDHRGTDSETAEAYFTTADGIVEFVLDRAGKRNALTTAMLDVMVQACDVADRPENKALVLRANGDHFAAGADVGLLRQIRTGDDALGYEEMWETYFSRLQSVQVPVIAVIRGYCVGGGIELATLCDVRIGSVSGKFGIPVAKTMGNAISMKNIDRLVRTAGLPIAAEMLVSASLVSAERLHNAGFLARLVADEDLETEARGFIEQIQDLSQDSVRGSKEMLRRYLVRSDLPDADDVLRSVYGGAEFARRVGEFGNKARTSNRIGFSKVR